MEKKGKQEKITERIGKRAKELGISKNSLAERVNIASNTFSNWAARGTMPPADIALAISDELQCSVRWLITGKDDKEEQYTMDEKNMIAKYRNLGKQDQFEIKALLEAKTMPFQQRKLDAG